jgi:two-component system, cell cycle response regulator
MTMSILVVDNDFRYRHTLEEALRRDGYEVETASDGKLALQVLQGNDPPRIAILNCRMPGIDTLDLCRKVRKRTQAPYIYIIITGKTHMRDIIADLHAEADDYLIQPFDFQELLARVQAGQQVVDMQTAQKKDPRYQATHDLLTGLWNLDGILEIADREMSRAKTEKTSLCLALVEIDGFENVKEVFGHSAGDCLLCEVAQKMRLVLRSYDDIGRYEEGKFAVIITDTDEKNLIKPLERLRNHIGARPFDVLERQISITASIGMAICPTTTRAPSAQSLLEAADNALHMAKALGSNRIEIAGAENIYTKTPILMNQHWKSAGI